MTRVFEDVDDLLSAVDVDQVDDIETSLIFLFRRPLALVQVCGEDGSTVGLEVFIRGSDEGIEYLHALPLSILDLVRGCAEKVAVLGTYAPDGVVTEASPHVSALNDSDLVTALREPLGQVRIFNLIDHEQ